MPLYEYECQSCGSRIEVLQRFTDPPLESCDCGDKGTLKKLVSAPAFQFKGEGWYVTDYARKQGNGKGDKAAAKSDADSGEKSSGSGDGSAGEKAAGSDKSSDKGSAKDAAAGVPAGKAERVSAATKSSTSTAPTT